MVVVVARAILMAQEAAARPQMEPRAVKVAVVAEHQEVRREAVVRAALPRLVAEAPMSPMRATGATLRATHN
jgi:hypothetical protein